MWQLIGGGFDFEDHRKKDGGGDLDVWVSNLVLSLWSLLNKGNYVFFKFIIK